MPTYNISIFPPPISFTLLEQAISRKLLILTVVWWKITCLPSRKNTHHALWMSSGLVTAYIIGHEVNLIGVNTRNFMLLFYMRAIVDYGG